MNSFLRRLLSVFFGALLFGMLHVHANELPIRGGQAPFSPLDPKSPSQLPAGTAPKARVSPLPTTTPLVAPEPPMNWRDKPVPVPSATGKL